MRYGILPIGVCYFLQHCVEAEAQRMLWFLVYFVGDLCMSMRSKGATT